MQNLLKNNPITEASDLDSDKAFPYTERQKMLEAILGMAMHAYRYDPSSTRNTATGNNKESISAGIQSIFTFLTRKAPAFRPEMDSVDAKGVLFLIVIMLKFPHFLKSKGGQP